MVSSASRLLYCADRSVSVVAACWAAPPPGPTSANVRSTRFGIVRYAISTDRNPEGAWKDSVSEFSVWVGSAGGPSRRTGGSSACSASNFGSTAGP